MKDWKAACLALVLLILGAGILLPRAEPLEPLPQLEERVISKILEDDFPDDLAALKAISAEKRRRGADLKEIQSRYDARSQVFLESLHRYIHLAPTSLVTDFISKEASLSHALHSADPATCAAWATPGIPYQPAHSKVHHAMAARAEAASRAAQAGKRSPVQRGPAQAPDYAAFRTDLLLHDHDPEMLQRAFFAADTVTRTQACDAQVIFYDTLARMEPETAARLLGAMLQWNIALFLPAGSD